MLDLARDDTGSVCFEPPHRDTLLPAIDAIFMAPSQQQATIVLTDTHTISKPYVLNNV